MSKCLLYKDSVYKDKKKKKKIGMYKDNLLDNNKTKIKLQLIKIIR